MQRGNNWWNSCKQFLRYRVNELLVYNDNGRTDGRTDRTNNRISSEANRRRSHKNFHFQNQQLFIELDILFFLQSLLQNLVCHVTSTSLQMLVSLCGWNRHDYDLPQFTLTICCYNLWTKLFTIRDMPTYLRVTIRTTVWECNQDNTNIVLWHKIATKLYILDNIGHKAEKRSSPQQQCKASDESSAKLDPLGRRGRRREFIESVHHQPVGCLLFRQTLPLVTNTLLITDI